MANQSCNQFHIQVRGQVRAEEVNGTGPIDMCVEIIGLDRTLLSFTSDQAGAMGILRYLNGMGFEILSFKRDEEE